LVFRGIPHSAGTTSRDAVRTYDWRDTACRGRNDSDLIATPSLGLLLLACRGLGEGLRLLGAAREDRAGEESEGEALHSDILVETEPVCPNWNKCLPFA
jgi:hypothetical protein